MATTATGAPRPGVSVGSTSEFSLFFQVKPGHEDDLREAVQALQRSPGYRPGQGLGKVLVCLVGDGRVSGPG